MSTEKENELLFTFAGNTKIICSITQYSKFSNNFTLVFNGVDTYNRCGEKLKLAVYSGVAHY